MCYSLKECPGLETPTVNRGSFWGLREKNSRARWWKQEIVSQREKNTQRHFSYSSPFIIQCILSSYYNEVLDLPGSKGGLQTQPTTWTRRSHGSFNCLEMVRTLLLPSSSHLAFLHLSSLPLHSVVALLRYDWYTKDSTCLMCTIWWVWTYANICATATTITETPIQCLSEFPGVPPVFAVTVVILW